MAIAALAAAPLLWCNAQQSTTSPPNQAAVPVVCDNGLKVWRADTNHTFGVWVANSTRIIKTEEGKYLPQFRDCKDTNAVWTSIFEGDKSFDDIGLSQRKLRQAFEINKAICDAFENSGRKNAKAP